MSRRENLIAAAIAALALVARGWRFAACRGATDRRGDRSRPKRAGGRRLPAAADRGPGRPRPAPSEPASRTALEFTASSRRRGLGRAGGDRRVRVAPGGEAGRAGRTADRVRLAERVRRASGSAATGPAVTTPALPNGQLGWVKLDRSSCEPGWTSSRSSSTSPSARAELGAADRVRGTRSRSRSEPPDPRPRPGASPSPTPSAATSTRPTAAARWRSARPSRTCPRAGSAATGSRSTAIRERSASPSRVAASAPRTRKSASW